MMSFTEFGCQPVYLTTHLHSLVLSVLTLLNLMQSKQKNRTLLLLPTSVAFFSNIRFKLFYTFLKRVCFCVFFLFFLFSIFKTVSHFCFFHLWKVLERTEVRETIAVFRPWTQKICSSPSILRLNLCLNSTLSHGTILRKESLVLCLAILLFSVAFILSKVN